MRRPATTACECTKYNESVARAEKLEVVNKSRTRRKNPLAVSVKIRVQPFLKGIFFAGQQSIPGISFFEE
jgi:hypothetical protein